MKLTENMSQYFKDFIEPSLGVVGARGEIAHDSFRHVNIEVEEQ